MKRVMILLIVSALFIALVLAQEQGTENNVNASDNKNKLQKNNSVVEKKLIDKIDFVPWQKRNDTECLDGCKCTGAVVSCETENGKTMTITAGSSGKELIITIGKTKVITELELEQETENNKSILRAKLSNGKKAEIKIMPDSASEKALERLKLKVCIEENGCIIELKEVGKDSEASLDYELKTERNSKVFGLFKAKMKVQANINAETGEIMFIKKPWWAFLATEPEE